MEMNGMKKYYEKNIDLKQGIKFYEAIKLCDNSGDYCFYENGDEISVGLGIYCDIRVTSKKIVMISEGNTNEIKIENFPKDFEKVLSEIKVLGWRMYGVAKFALARYVYCLDCENEKDELCHFIIPAKEYRIKDKSVVLRTFRQEELQQMEKEIGNIVGTKHFDEVIGDFFNSDAVINFDEVYYKEIVTNGIKEIQQGKYKKIILSRKVQINSRLDMKKTYVHGRKANTPARSYIYKIGEDEVVGFSPETVTEVEADGTVYTFPLAGTRALTQNAKENEKLRSELLNDTKEIAEHAISVKLADEEMQQICEKDTVIVTEFMSVMERGTVQHLGSRLRGKLKKECNSWHALCKLFPAVTASGIPKREAIKAIGRMEKDPRDLYSGSVLIYDCDGRMDAALVLRSVFQTEKETWVRVGAGIVEMSNPEREFIETQEKVSSVAKQLVLKG